MPAIKLSAHGLDALQRGLKKAPAYTQEQLLATMKGVTSSLEGQVIDAMPAVSGSTRETVAGDAFSTPAGVLGVVGTNSVSGLILEIGRKPGTWVSAIGQEAIANWAVKKLGVSIKEAPGIAYLIARKIKAHGLPAKKPFQKTMDRHWGDINRDFENCAARIAAHLAGDVNGGLA